MYTFGVRNVSLVDVEDNAGDPLVSEGDAAKGTAVDMVWVFLGDTASRA